MSLRGYPSGFLRKRGADTALRQGLTRKLGDYHNPPMVNAVGAASCREHRIRGKRLVITETAPGDTGAQW
jgi:hypothetical protein